MQNKKRFFFGLRLKFTILIALVITVMMYYVNDIISQEVEHSLRDEMTKRGSSIATNLAILAQEPLNKRPIDDLTLLSTVKEIEEDDPDIREVFIIDRKNRVIAHNELMMTDKTYQPPLGIRIEPPIPPVQRYFDNSRELYFFSAPITIQSQPIAMTHVVIATTSIQATIDDLQTQNRLITLLGIIIAIILTYIVVHLLIAPLKWLMVGAARIGAGNFDQHIKVRFQDEIGALTMAFNEMALNLKEKEHLKNALRSYIPLELIERIRDNPDILTPGGASKNLSIMFTDIRGFTRLSEGASPSEVVEMLNEHLTLVSEVIIKHGGWVDKFMGDAVLGFFGAPIEYDDKQARAVSAAIEIQERIATLNIARIAGGKLPINIGIGINTGDVHVGIIGTRDKMDYTVIGDAVNTAQRLESIAKPGQILVSRSTISGLEKEFILIEHDPVKVKGKEEPVKIFEVATRKK